jgi:uncharacterized protein
VDTALIASATLLGLAGSPHCAAMCSAPCAAALGRGGPGASAVFHVARVAGYAAGGAAAAASVAALAHWSAWSPALRPVWVLLHAAALALGLWLLVQARQPAWMAALGRVPAVEAGPGWQRMRGPVRAAAMASEPMGGAAAMGGFAIASSPGLLLGPWAWRHLMRGTDAAARERWATRAAGLLLVAASGWALGHGVWHRVAAFCATL